MFCLLALVFSCFNFIDFAESTAVNISGNLEYADAIARSLRPHELSFDLRMNGDLKTRPSSIVIGDSGKNNNNPVRWLTIPGRNPMEMQKTAAKADISDMTVGLSVQESRLRDVIADIQNERKYLKEERTILKTAKGKRFRRSTDDETLTTVKPVLNANGVMKTTTIPRPLNRQHDSPLQPSDARRCQTSYSKWSGWLKCSATDCKRAGKQMRTRSCFADSLKAADYEKCSYENLVDIRACKPVFCTGKSPESIRWSEWSTCSVTCGQGGYQTRRKLCFARNQNGQSTPIKCSGINFQRRLCQYSISCPSWDTWSLWSSCSKTCGQGRVAHRSRKCVVQRYITFHNTGLPGSQFDTSSHQPSIELPNVVNKNAVITGRMRNPLHESAPAGREYRTVDGKRIFVVDALIVKAPSSEQLFPQFHQDSPITENIDVISCMKSGDSNEEERKCAQKNCPSVWTTWAPWSSCTASCGIGISRRKRSCKGKTAEGFCIGKMYAYRRCYTPPCWSGWSDWADCSGPCGSPNGVKTRLRKCSGKTFVIPQYTKCAGEAKQVSKCQTESCPGDGWGNWGQFGKCNVSCDGGYSNRSRICLTPPCSGSNQDFRECNDHSCPMWSQWTLFSCCSVTCGVGTRQRSRICLAGDSETTGCIGDLVDRKRCYKPLCNAPQKESPFTGFRCGIGSTANLKMTIRLRIFGGTKSSAHEWPWQLSWQHRESSSSDWLHFCGATLIHPRWVVTASHCTEESDYVVNHDDPGDSWSVVAGMVRLYKDGTRYFADRIFIHPKYKYKAVTKNDIALIKLRRMVPITDSVMPACMPRKRRPQPGAECYVTGWGYTNADRNASLSSNLREATVPILRFGQCRNLGDYYRYFLDSTMHMCAGNPVSASSDSCTGDSGGPLVCQRNKRWYIAAVTSFGFDDCGTPGHAGIYAPMDTYEPWIRATINLHTYEKC